MSTDEVKRDLSCAIEFWRIFGLSQRITALENTCTELREAKGASVAGRRQLNDLTKSFRSKPPLEQQVCITELLKAYQEEIDQLSRRSKRAETEFFSLFRDLAGAPDPVISLTALQSFPTERNTSEAEIERLRAELKQNDEEFRGLQNQDVTIRRLEEELNELRLAQEEAVESLITQRVSEAVRDIADQQQFSERRITSTIDALRAAQEQEARAQAQVLEVQARADVRASELESECAQLVDCRERMQARIADLEQELTILRISIAHSKGPVASGQIPLASNGESQVEVEFVSILRHQLQERESLNKQLQENLSATTREFQMLLTQAKKTAEEAMAALARAPKADEMQAARRKARILQRIAFNKEEEELNDEDEDDDTLFSNTGIDSMVLGRLGALESELNICRSRVNELAASEQVFRSAAADAELRASNALALVSRLEADLEFGRGNGVSSYAQRNASSVTNSNMISLQNLLGLDTSSAQLLDVSKNSFLGGENSGNMAVILQGQRDRYKERLTASDHALTVAKRQIDELLGVRQQLENALSAQLSKKIHNPGWQRPKEVDAESGLSHELKSNSNYRSGGQPSETDAVSAGDRIVHAAIATFISTSAGRAGVVTYIATMHVLCFLSLYFLVYHVDHGCDLNIDHLSHVA